MSNFFVAISHGHGVVMCIHHDWKITGENFANHIVKREFPLAFKKCGSVPLLKFLQDGCSRENARVAQKAWEECGYEMVKIPARSPDLNLIENLLNLVRTKLKADAIKDNLVKESYEQFTKRIKTTIEGFPISTIDNLISSMPKRMSSVLRLRGNRTKY